MSAAGVGGCDGWLAGSPGCYDRHSGAQASAGRCADASDAQAKVDAAVVLAADVSRSIDDSEFILEWLATYSAMNSNPTSVGSGGCSRHDVAPVRTLLLLLVVDP